MSDSIDLLIAVRDLGLSAPAAGDEGDRRCRAALARELAGGRERRRRVRVSFGTRSITIAPVVILALLATAALAATLAVLNPSPTALFTRNPQSNRQTVIPSTIRKLATIHIPGVGALQYWTADTEQHGVCWGLREANGSWLVLGRNGTFGTPPTVASSGIVPGCGSTRKQAVLRQGNSPTGLMPMSVDYLDDAVKNSRGQWWDIYFGTVTANDPVAVRDETTGRTAKLIDGRYFILSERLTTNLIGGDTIRAIDAAGHPLPANYGPAQYRNH